MAFNSLISFPSFFKGARIFCMLLTGLVAVWAFSISIMGFDYEVQDWYYVAITLATIGDFLLLIKYPKLGFIGFGLLIVSFYLFSINSDIRVFVGLQDPIIIND